MPGATIFREKRNWPRLEPLPFACTLTVTRLTVFLPRLRTIVTRWPTRNGRIVPATLIRLPAVTLPLRTPLSLTFVVVAWTGGVGPFAAVTPAGCVASPCRPSVTGSATGSGVGGAAAVVVLASSAEAVATRTASERTNERRTTT